MIRNSITISRYCVFRTRASSITEHLQIYVDAYDAANSISAAQARVLIQQLIAGLKDFGVRKGDTVLVHAFNSIYYPIIVLGIIGCGAIYSGSNPAYTAYEVETSR